MVDRVQPLKIESPTSGGTQTDLFPTSVNVQEDYLECAGLAVQDADNRDETTLIYRDGYDLMFQDVNNPVAYTLTELAAGAIDLNDVVLDLEGQVVYVNDGEFVMRS